MQKNSDSPSKLEVRMRFYSGNFHAHDIQRSISMSICFTIGNLFKLVEERLKLFIEQIINFYRTQNSLATEQSILSTCHEIPIEKIHAVSIADE